MINERIVRTNTNQNITGQKNLQDTFTVYNGNNSNMKATFLMGNSFEFKVANQWQNNRVFICDVSGFYLAQDLLNFSGNHNIGSTSSQMNKVFVNYISKGNDDISFEDLKNAIAYLKTNNLIP